MEILDPRSAYCQPYLAQIHESLDPLHMHTDPSFNSRERARKQFLVNYIELTCARCGAGKIRIGDLWSPLSSVSLTMFGDEISYRASRSPTANKSLLYCRSTN